MYFNDPRSAKKEILHSEIRGGKSLSSLSQVKYTYLQFHNHIITWNLQPDNQPLPGTKGCASQWCPAGRSKLTPASYIMALPGPSPSAAYILKSPFSGSLPKWESNHAQVSLFKKHENKSFFFGGIIDVPTIPFSYGTPALGVFITILLKMLLI